MLRALTLLILTVGLFGSPFLFAADHYCPTALDYSSLPQYESGDNYWVRCRTSESPIVHGPWQTLEPIPPYIKITSDDVDNQGSWFMFITQESMVITTDTTEPESEPEPEIQSGTNTNSVNLDDIAQSNDHLSKILFVGFMVLLSAVGFTNGQQR